MADRVRVLPDFVEGTPPARFPFFRIFTILRNILETADGIDRGTGPGSANGYGWTFGPSAYAIEQARVFAPRAFDLFIDGDTANVCRCWYMRGPVWVEREEEPTFELSGTEVVLCAKINTETGEVTLDDTPDAAVPDTSEFFRAPLYKLERAASDDAWRVAVDLRPGCLVMWV